ncbi:MAG: PHA/PHB synthase family protein [Vulcanimicrobiaceae bacterium]
MPPNPFDPLGIARASINVWGAMLAQPQTILEGQAKLASAWSELATQALAPPAQRTALIEPAPGDNRWKHPAWSENPFFDALKQGYLLSTQAMIEGIERAEGVPPEVKARVKYFANQFADALSPTNFPMLNPAVIEETLRTGGENLRRGAQNVVADATNNRGRPALVDTAAFRVGENVATSPGAVVFRNELIELIEYAPSTPTVFARPLLIVPPWINKFYILDLQPKNSLIKFAVDAGVRTFVISWRNPDASLGKLGFTDYLELGPLAAAEAISKITGSADVNQIGYCIGGTLSAMELAYLARTRRPLVNAVTFFAALTDFAEAGDIKHFLGPEALAHIETQMKEKGVLDASAMADTFSLLRANDLIWNVAVNRYLLGKDAPAFDLLYWNNDATRMPATMHAYYLEHMYVRNELAQPDALEVRGVPIDLRQIRNDLYVVASRDDHIAPWRSVYKLTQLASGAIDFRLANSGHIAGIINPPSSGKGNFWTNERNEPDPEAWLAGARKTDGSWWNDWIGWLGERSGERVPAPASPGSAEFPPLGPAPGTYVLEKA